MHWDFVRVCESMRLVAELLALSWTLSEYIRIPWKTHSGQAKNKAFLKVDIVEIKGVHLMTTVSMTPPVSIAHLIIIMTGVGWVPNVLAVSHIHLTSALSAVCVSLASSLHLVILLSHVECEGKRRAGGDYTDCYSCVRCLFVSVFAHVNAWFLVHVHTVRLFCVSHICL